MIFTYELEENHLLEFLSLDYYEIMESKLIVYRWEKLGTYNDMKDMMLVNVDTQERGIGITFF